MATAAAATLGLMRIRRLTLPLLFAIVAACAVGSGALAQGEPVAVRPLALGFGDPVSFGLPGAAGAAWWQRAVNSASTVVRLQSGWIPIAPTQPADPTNPADPAYHWTALDQQVREAASYGLEPIITLSGAPAWALGGGAPTNAPPGTWKPNATAYGQFAVALGRRYSGDYPDPLHPGSDLPLVRFWEPWNEPNLSAYLTPQWTRRGHHWLPASPSIYRGILNAFYAGIKSTNPGAQVIAGGTAPFGDPPGGSRMTPVTFDRAVFCLSGRALTPLPCPQPAHFDILDHHPYAVGSPFTHALDPGDVSIPDLAKLSTPLAKAERTGRVLPAGSKPLMVTEVSYDTDPPDPHGVAQPKAALWTEETLYELWSEGVNTISWYLIADQPPIPNYAATYQSGMYLINGTPKLSEQAFRFPLVVDTRNPKHEVLWTRVPAAGTLVVQRLAGGSATTLFSTAVSADEVVERVVTGGRGRFRASVAGQSSLVWPP
jgi:hypothetical protein